MEKRIWFITGISSGLGRALAQALIEKDAFVLGTFRQQQQADEFNAANANKGFAFVLNLNDEKQIEEVAQQAIDKFGKIDVLVNNAGVGFAGAIEETSLPEIRAIFETNFFGTLKLTQALLPVFRRQKSGHIIQISSHGGVKAFAGFGIYNASKFALEGFSEALAQEIAPLGIKLTIVEPGPFRTSFAGPGFGLATAVIDDYNATAGLFRERIKGVDGKQEGDPAKAAQAIIDVANAEQPPLRLPLGKIAIGTITAKIESIQNDLNANRQIAEQAVF
ncbi:oxidoreductase [Hymenobacter terrenus]|uniref:oxidoreductase n=1 Tax=Hymenobacter terrenus TaxID=1629124 RepID=UPI000619D7D1|nr:oxidoreductase [Hymenobacter terrenus]